LTTVSTDVEFYQGTVGPLFRIIRTPEKVHSHLLFIAPLFEQANQTRHHITRSAINAYHQGMQSIVFDHYGTGDSHGELIDSNLELWQQDILCQLRELKAQSTHAVYLSLPLSAVLLLTKEMLGLTDGVMLLQPDFNGKRFVQQFKRIALAAELTKDNSTQRNKSNNTDVDEEQVLEIAGYVMQSKLLDELAGQDINKLADFNVDCYWFEWQEKSEVLSPSRIKQQVLANKHNKLFIQQVDDVKFWQATELQIAQSFLMQEKSLFSQLTLSTSTSTSVSSETEAN
jgi:exosortase A-associated hydrolase 2